MLNSAEEVDGRFHEYFVEERFPGYSVIVYTDVLEKSLKEFSEVTLRQGLTTVG